MTSPAPTRDALPPGRGRSFWRWVLRSVLVLVPLVSLGILSWMPMLWLAIVLRRLRDWIGFAVVAALANGGFVLAGYTDDENDWQTNTGVAVILALGLGTAVYVLVADLARTRAVPLPATPPPPFHTPPLPLPPRNHRVDQVRAELDELSAYLRQQENSP